MHVLMSWGGVCACVSMPTVYIYRGHADRHTLQDSNIRGNLRTHSTQAGRQPLDLFAGKLLDSLCLGKSLPLLG